MLTLILLNRDENHTISIRASGPIGRYVYFLIMTPSCSTLYIHSDWLSNVAVLIWERIATYMGFRPIYHR